MQMSTFASKLNNFKLQKKKWKHQKKPVQRFILLNAMVTDIKMQDNKMISMHRDIF